MGTMSPNDSQLHMGNAAFAKLFLRLEPHIRAHQQRTLTPQPVNGIQQRPRAGSSGDASLDSERVYAWRARVFNPLAFDVHRLGAQIEVESCSGDSQEAAGGPGRRGDGTYKPGTVGRVRY